VLATILMSFVDLMRPSAQSGEGERRSFSTGRLGPSHHITPQHFRPRYVHLEAFMMQMHEWAHERMSIYVFMYSSMCRFAPLCLETPLVVFPTPVKVLLISSWPRLAFPGDYDPLS
jgi:hypothetical protein